MFDLSRFIKSAHAQKNVCMGGFFRPDNIRTTSFKNDLSLFPSFFQSLFKKRFCTYFLRNLSVYGLTKKTGTGALLATLAATDPKMALSNAFLPLVAMMTISMLSLSI